VTQINYEKWLEVLRKSQGRWSDFISLENLDKRKYGKVLRKQVIAEVSSHIFTAIGKTANGDYEMFQLTTCHEEVEEWNWDDINKEDGDIDIFWIHLITIPQVISIICYLILLIFYLTIEELRKTVHGKCWINFFINSLINYLAAIFQLLYIKRENESFIYYSYSGNSGRTRILDFFTFKVSSTVIIFTEFSLYFWLNITFFEAFYNIR
jgi:hypothetical protein